MCIVCDVTDKSLLVDRKKIYCYNCPNLKEIPKELVNLKDLCCINCPNLKEIPNDLVNLEHFVLYNCPQLEKLPTGMINLERLWIQDCPITYIPKEYNKLTLLECWRCPNLVDIPNCSLKTLSCRDCPILTFAPTQLINTPSQIHQIEIVDNNYQRYRKEGCKKLVDTIFEELIQRTWEPKRAIEWCWDDEEKKFMSNYIT
jgi:hypothetical protein